MSIWAFEHQQKSINIIGHGRWYINRFTSYYNSKLNISFTILIVHYLEPLLHKSLFEEFCSMICGNFMRKGVIFLCKFKSSDQDFTNVLVLDILFWGNGLVIIKIFVHRCFTKANYIPFVRRFNLISSSFLPTIQPVYNLAGFHWQRWLLCNMPRH